MAKLHLPWKPSCTICMYVVGDTDSTGSGYESVLGPDVLVSLTLGVGARDRWL